MKSEQTMKSDYKKKLEDFKMTAEVLLETEFDENPSAPKHVELKGSCNNVFSNDIALHTCPFRVKLASQPPTAQK